MDRARAEEKKKMVLDKMESALVGSNAALAASNAALAASQEGPKVTPEVTQ